MRDVPQIAIDLIEGLETAVYRVYDDARPNVTLQPGDTIHGTLTAGYGHTGQGLRIGLEVSRSAVIGWLLLDLDHAAMELRDKIGEAVVATLTEHQYAALLSFVFNLGTGDPTKPEWTIWKLLRAEKYDQIPGEMSRFVNTHVDGQLVKSEGLVHRRAAEVTMWSTAEPGSVTINQPSSVTRAIATPPTPAPGAKSTAIVAGVGAAAASAAPMVNQMTSVITPYADHSDYVRHLLAFLAGVGAVLACVTVAVMWWEKRKAQN